MHSNHQHNKNRTIIVDIIEEKDHLEKNKSSKKMQQTKPPSTSLIPSSENTSIHHENGNITAENIEIVDASVVDFSMISTGTSSRHLAAIIQDDDKQLVRNENNSQPKEDIKEIQPDITPPPPYYGNDNHQNKLFESESSVSPKENHEVVDNEEEKTQLTTSTAQQDLIRIESFSIRPSYSRIVLTDNNHQPECNDLNNRKLTAKHHLDHLSNSTTSNCTSDDHGEEETFSIYTCGSADSSNQQLNEPPSNSTLLQLFQLPSTQQDESHHQHLGHHHQHNMSNISSSSFMSGGGDSNINTQDSSEFKSTLDLLQSLRDEQSKVEPKVNHQLHNIVKHVNNNKSNPGNSTRENLPVEKNTQTTTTAASARASDKKKNQKRMSKWLNIAAYALLDVSFVLGAALFVAGCGLLIASNVTYFFSGILLFIIGSALFLIGPLGKTIIDLMNLIKHYRWERKVREIHQQDVSASSKRLKDQMHELHQDLSSYRPSDLPSLKMIALELINDCLLIVGGLTFTVGSSLYMLNPPILVVIIAEVNWSIGAISYFIVSIIQYIVKQVDIIKSASSGGAAGGMDVNVKCFTFMSIDLSAYLLNIASSLLFIIGSGCFLVNERSLEITGEVIWSLGCVAMIVSVLFNRIIWIKNTWFNTNESPQDQAQLLL